MVSRPLRVPARFCLPALPAAPPTPSPLLLPPLLADLCITPLRFVGVWHR